MYNNSFACDFQCYQKEDYAEIRWTFSLLCCIIIIDKNAGFYPSRQERPSFFVTFLVLPARDTNCATFQAILISNIRPLRNIRYSSETDRLYHHDYTIIIPVLYHFNSTLKKISLTSKHRLLILSKICFAK